MNGRRRLAGEYGFHELEHWQSVADWPGGYGPMRVAALAYAGVRGNGHVRMSNDDLIEALPILDKKTGELRAPSESSVKRWRVDAIRQGLLHEATSEVCLVLPAGVYTKLKKNGSAYLACLVCRR